MNPNHLFLVKRGTSEQYTSPAGKVVQFITMDDALYYQGDIIQRTKTDWDVMTVGEYFELFHPKKAVA